MIKTFTQDDVIRLMYQETTEAENIEIKNAFVCNNFLLEEFEELSLLKNDLDKLWLTPPKRIVDKILNYSKETKTVAC